VKATFTGEARYTLLILRDQRPSLYLRRLGYYSALIASAVAVPLSPYPFVALLGVGYVYHMRNLRGRQRVTLPPLVIGLGVVLTAGIVWHALRAGLRISR
jgi:hypothetical protein